MTSEGKSVEHTNQRFERLVTPLQLDLVRYALWLSKDRCLAEEIVQETLFRAWRSFNQLKDDRCLKPWLITIARREHARHYSRKGLETKSIDELSAFDARFLSVWENTDSHDIRTAILALDAMYRKPLYLQVVLGFTMKEISASMGICGATVASRLHRARRKLIESSLRFDVFKSIH